MDRSIAVWPTTRVHMNIHAWKCEYQLFDYMLHSRLQLVLINHWNLIFFSFIDEYLKSENQKIDEYNAKIEKQNVPDMFDAVL